MGASNRSELYCSAKLNPPWRSTAWSISSNGAGGRGSESVSSRKSSGPTKTPSSPRAKAVSPSTPRVSFCITNET